MHCGSKKGSCMLATRPYCKYTGQSLCLQTHPGHLAEDIHDLGDSLLFARSTKVGRLKTGGRIPQQDDILYNIHLGSWNWTILSANTAWKIAGEISSNNNNNKKKKIACATWKKKSIIKLALLHTQANTWIAGPKQSLATPPRGPGPGHHPERMDCHNHV